MNTILQPQERFIEMKIEIGESLLLSWLRHVKECQIVQTNWKASAAWELKNKDELLRFMERSSDLFLEKYGYNLYKKSGLAQLIKQAEIDVLGINFEEESNHIYAIDVAFHEGGLNYGSKKETVERIAKKCLRSVMCIYGYYGFSNATIIFTSPKTSFSLLLDIEAVINTMKQILSEFGLNYEIIFISNDDFNIRILEPILKVLGNVADTSELFMRSLQLKNLFKESAPKQSSPIIAEKIQPESARSIGTELQEMKIGVIVRSVVRDILEHGNVSQMELTELQSLNYSKKVFHINFPFLQEESIGFDKSRYYASPITIGDKVYFICSQWYEEQRPYVLEWIAAHP